MARCHRRGALPALGVSAAASLVACSFLVDTEGLAGRAAPTDAAPEASAPPEDDAATERPFVFAEDWETPPTRWTPVPDLEAEPCSTTFQRETIRVGGGRVRLVSPLAVRGGASYCMVAWIRGSSLTQPFLGVEVGGALSDGGLIRHWLMGRPGYSRGYDDGSTVVPITSDGRWRWYAATFVVDAPGTTLDIVDELYEEGAPGAADFDDIRVYEGACPSAPVGAPHDCP